MAEKVTIIEIPNSHASFLISILLKAYEKVACDLRAGEVFQKLFLSLHHLKHASQL